MQVIQTKYLGPTNTKGPRVKAWCHAKQMTFKWGHSFNTEENHIAAAEKLAETLSWQTKLASGQLPNGDYAHVIFA